MNENIIYRMCFFSIFYAICFAGMYFYGRKGFPVLAPVLCTGLWLFFTITMHYAGGATMSLLALLTVIILLFVLKPPPDNSIQLFFSENKIYKSEEKPKAVIDLLGNRKWLLAEGRLYTRSNEWVRYLFWQGSSSFGYFNGKNYVSNHRYYLAFIFEPNTVSEHFKKKAEALMDKSHYTWKEKWKYFFTLDTDKPYLVTTTTDGGFVIAYDTFVDAKVYAKNLAWIKANIEIAPKSNQHTATYQPSWQSRASS
ncbi:hypothetical protein [Emticicia sp. BO119]|uniref:hypothetical protein n=1 Tax=Emticicia sp. BO119 TaxID=2757768 RepID=UPI0015EFE578|nr:hypothetical protein [Emticicia sp. BO119]MBA4850817.1 hypothetical protein [Emticicia sp. BO119]